MTSQGGVMGGARTASGDQVRSRVRAARVCGVGWRWGRGTDDVDDDDDDGDDVTGGARAGTVTVATA